MEGFIFGILRYASAFFIRLKKLNMNSDLHNSELE